MMTTTDALAAERFRTILADAVQKTGYDAYAAGAEADPDRIAHAVIDDFSEFRFERHVNEHGVAMRRVVVASKWEVDLVPPKRCENCTPGYDCESGTYVRESDWRHEFVPIRYKGQREAGCGHFIRTSSHEGRMCGLLMSDAAHQI